MVLLVVLGGFGSFWVVLGRFGWFWVVPCFSNYVTPTATGECNYTSGEASQVCVNICEIIFG